jgi:hypothetical protein
MTSPQFDENSFKSFGLPQSVDVNLYRKKDPDQNYSGWGYALNNLMRNPNLLGGLRMPQESLIPQDNPMNRLGGLNGGGLAQVGLPFMADLIFGNKYRNT